mmetsp:Transcript_21673/g.3569  ORF Transcript_21673/g.3569 Transcript_21673/m.3569 type:complete len:122 (-) Transcript_21673:767-1132(-)
MDLFLCPRIVRPKINIDPDSLIPELPDPETLKPFPDQLRMVYKGHESRVTCFEYSRDGIWLASGDSVGNLKVWEANTGKCVINYNIGKKIYSVSWNPILPLIAVSSDKNIVVKHIEFINDY